MVPLTRRRFVALLLFGGIGAGVYGSSIYERLFDKRSIGDFDATMVNDPPEEAVITASSDLPLSDLPVLQALLDKAADPESERGQRTIVRGECDDQYEAVAYYGGSGDERREAATELDNIPLYSDDGSCYPGGYYISHKDQIMAVRYLVLEE